MELSPGVIIVLALVVVVSFVLLRWGRRNEAPPLLDAPAAPVRSNPMAARAGSDSQTLVHWLLDRALEQTGVNLAGDPLALQRIEEAAGKAMEELRTSSSTMISLPFLVADASGPKHFSVQIKRNLDSTFELDS